MLPLVSSFRQLPAPVAGSSGWQGPELASLVLLGTRRKGEWFRMEAKSLIRCHLRWHVPRCAGCAQALYCFEAIVVDKPGAMSISLFPKR